MSSLMPVRWEVGDAVAVFDPVQAPFTLHAWRRELRPSVTLLLDPAGSLGQELVALAASNLRGTVATMEHDRIHISTRRAIRDEGHALDVASRFVTHLMFLLEGPEPRLRARRRRRRRGAT